MVGSIKLNEFRGMTKMPQGAASAWAWFDGSGIVGAAYKPLLFLGEQIVRGTNFWFIAEQTLITREPVRRVVKLAINELQGEYSLVKPIEIIA